MKTLLAAVAIAAAFTMPAHAEEDVSIFWIKALPFVKAAAYAQAIDDYCFADKRYSFEAYELQMDDPRGELSAMAYDQATAARMAFNGEYLEDAKTIREEAEQKAAAHLQNNYAACQPAIAFVEKAIAAIPEMEPKLRAMAKQLEANVAATKAKVAAK